MTLAPAPLQFGLSVDGIFRVVYDSTSWGLESSYDEPCIATQGSWNPELSGSSVHADGEVGFVAEFVVQGPWQT